MQRLGAAERSTGSVAHVSRAPLAAFLTCAPLSPSVVCLSARIVFLLIEEREKSLCTAQRVFPAIRAHRYVEGSDKSNRKDTCSSVVAQASAPMSCTQPDKKKISPCTLHHPRRKHNEGMDETTETLWRGAGGGLVAEMTRCCSQRPCYFCLSRMRTAENVWPSGFLQRCVSAGIGTEGGGRLASLLLFAS